MINTLQQLANDITTIRQEVLDGNTITLTDEHVNDISYILRGYAIPMMKVIKAFQDGNPLDISQQFAAGHRCNEVVERGSSIYTGITIDPIIAAYNDRSYTPDEIVTDFIAGLQMSMGGLPTLNTIFPRNINVVYRGTSHTAVEYDSNPHIQIIDMGPIIEEICSDEFHETQVTNEYTLPCHHLLPMQLVTEWDGYLKSNGVVSVMEGIQGSMYATMIIPINNAVTAVTLLAITDVLTGNNAIEMILDELRDMDKAEDIDK